MIDRRTLDGPGAEAILNQPSLLGNTLFYILLTNENMFVSNVIMVGDRNSRNCFLFKQLPFHNYFAVACQSSSRY